LETTTAVRTDGYLKGYRTFAQEKRVKPMDSRFHLDQLVRLYFKPYKNGCLCSVCGRRGTIIRSRPEPHEWRDLEVGGWQLRFVYTPREIHCATHGRVEEQIPWAEPYSRVTHRFEYAMLRFRQNMTQKAAAELLGVSRSTLSHQLHRSLQRRRAGHRVRGLKHIGIDEISFKTGDKYATLVYDLDRSKVIGRMLRCE